MQYRSVALSSSAQVPRSCSFSRVCAAGLASSVWAMKRVAKAHDRRRRKMEKVPEQRLWKACAHTSTAPSCTLHSLPSLGSRSPLRTKVPSSANSMRA